MAVDAVLAVADLETKDVNFELIKMLTKVHLYWYFSSYISRSEESSMILS